MKVVNRIFLFTILTFLCTSFKQPHYVKIINKISNEYISELNNQFGLLIYGYGGAMTGDIQTVSFSFMSHEALVVDEARKLYVDVAEGFLKKINADARVRPYLHNYPFEFNNLRLKISFRETPGKHIGNGAVALVLRGRNSQVFYEGYDHEKTDDFYDLHDEPYEEALRIVKQNQPSNLLIGYN